MNRRNVLIGLGGVVAGGGALIGTGAFTTVEAQRTVSVETADDADAFLGLSAARNDFEGGNFVTENGGTIEINLDGDSPGQGDGLNQDARTVFRELVTVSNNGTQNVDELTLSFDNLDDTTDLDADETFSFPVDGNIDGTEFSEEYDNGVNMLDADTVELLEPGQEINFGLEIDLIEGGDDGDLPTVDNLDGDDDYTLTINAIAEDQ